MSIYANCFHLFFSGSLLLFSSYAVAAKVTLEASNWGLKEGEACISCHTKSSAGLTHQWKNSAHAKASVNCLDCHQAYEEDADAMEHEGSIIATIVSPKDCGRCHTTEFKQQTGSVHAKAVDIIKNRMPALAEHFGSPSINDAGCAKCHGSEVIVKGDGTLDPTTWPNTGIGRINPDGSRGSCSSCHGRHQFSKAQAREPSACTHCHSGPDSPDKDVYETSKHGMMYAAYKHEMNMNSDSWVVGKDYSAAPTCVTCHMGTVGKMKSTHDVGMRDAWNLNEAVSTQQNLVIFDDADKRDHIVALLEGIVDDDEGDKTEEAELIQLLKAFQGGGADEDKKPNPHLGKPVTIDGKDIPSLPMESNPQQARTSDACMGCHDKRNNSHGTPLCATGDEYAQSKAQVDCLSCHMPVSNGIVDHSIGGGHDKGMLQRSIVFSMNSQKSGDTIKSTIRMQNKQPHTMPTGAPFRNMHLKVTAYDASGKVVWENAKGHPGKTDKKAFMRLVLVDDSGKPVGPPQAKKQGADTRLKAFEKRDLNYDIPAKDVVLVRAELYYNLLWPGLVKKFGKKIPADVTAPVLIAASENSI